MSSEINLQEIHSDGRGAHLQLTFVDNERGRSAKAYLKGKLEMQGVRVSERGHTISFRVPAKFDNSDYQRHVAVHVQQARTVSLHGGYAMETRFIMTQHMYAGSDHAPFVGFVELLEIANPPPGKHPLVIFERWNGQARFYEFQDLMSAEQCFGRIFIRLGNSLSAKDGLIRAIDCGERRPWFYAGEGELPEGDFMSEKVSTRSS
ncbi:MAG TPA: hypothetical protein PLF71_01875 [bacterium]|nr:MAG: hypothetical protein BWY14_01118 [Parcubacteria group bacterium ADurb.Bin192]HPN14844.1 hypothetical protein [bacterium]